MRRNGGGLRPPPFVMCLLEERNRLETTNMVAGGTFQMARGATNGLPKRFCVRVHSELSKGRQGNPAGRPTATAAEEIDCCEVVE